VVSRRVLLVIVVVAILAVSAGYYISGLSNSRSVTVTIQVTSGTLQNGAADVFEPRNFTVTEGQQVTIVFENTDDGPHELTIPAFGVSTGIVQGGQTARVIFVPNQTGNYEYLEPQGVCDANGISAAQGGCTGVQETNGNMTVLAP